ncbi:putative glutamine transport system substrate-binding protein [Enterococcus sp. PF1-24]|uniref:transporter substrate-binding domain-containing protein n=1 Tax=unclassified Enterococcus TaxID=2608891 RepID=UPI0024763B4B|nr:MULTISPECIES: transporter substrate-binding domain-containing protein [unclassified Enterococcus]MDH6365139.1 putative glutamine transport system substrate-binding protein [Enterococcus sp. PFB1-1]MDH6402277.1 putative glutamine transport system substrate-binding protein [Enterococcus sp. PF1-24]
MKKISKIFFSFVATLTLLTLASCKGQSVAELDVLEQAKENNEIFWGVKYDTRLFGMMNIATGETEGFDIDIAKAITEEILGEDGQATFVEVTSKTRIPLLKNGNIDSIIATMTITEERQKQVNFSDVYFNAGQSLLVKNDCEITRVEDLTAEHTVLAVKGSTPAENIKIAAPDAKVLELENYAECFTALQSGQGDTMTTDNAILLGMSSENPDYGLVGGTFTEEPYGIAINKGQDNFTKAVNDALAAMHENGKYQEIYHKWFPDNDDGMA